MIKSIAGRRLDPLLHRLFPFLFVWRLNPNALTVIGVLVSLGAAVAFADGRPRLAAGLVLFGGFFDLVDGVIARHQGTSSRFGAFLDATLDRLSDMALLLGISVHAAALADPGGVALAGAVLCASVLVSYSKARAELVVPGFSAGFMERGERVAALAAGALLGLLTPALWLILVGSSITVAQRFALAYREMERMDRAEKDAVETLG
ncbi:MAG TPA: CDP-alcohol phosphatidyltransferase family protein [Myxococcota bacterium]|nr:CDP-alcohol phosphatidyltransferase family protein [Myxococcota bacterium]